MTAPIFDAHFHIVDPRFPLIAQDDKPPESYTSADYRQAVEGLGFAGGTIISGSFQAFDQEYLVAALAELGPFYVGVTQIPQSMLDHEILRLHEGGVRAVRYDLRRNPAESVARIESFAKRLHKLCGWHIEIYADLSKLSADEISILARLPKLAIDYLGLNEPGLIHAVELARGGAKVKAAGFGRVWLDPVKAMEAIAAASPDALMFGSDLPATRARRPFEPADLGLIESALGAELARKALYQTALEFYRPAASQSPA